MMAEIFKDTMGVAELVGHSSESLRREPGMAASNEFGHELPTEADALRALGRVIGAEMAEGIWDLTTKALGVGRPVAAAEDLRRVAEHIMTVGEAARIGGRSLKVRVVTFDALPRVVAT
jgi:hypothetical protein